MHLGLVVVFACVFNDVMISQTQDMEMITSGFPLEPMVRRFLCQPQSNRHWPHVYPQTSHLLAGKHDRLLALDYVVRVEYLHQQLTHVLGVLNTNSAAHQRAAGATKTPYSSPDQSIGHVRSTASEELKANYSRALRSNGRLRHAVLEFLVNDYALLPYGTDWKGDWLDGRSLAS